MTEQKKGPKGPREVFFTFSAIVNGELIQESIYSPKGTNPDLFTEAAAIAIFEQNYGVKPAKSKGPCFDKKRALIKLHQEVPNIEPEFIKTGSRYDASCGGFFGIAFDLEGESQKELMYFVPLKSEDNGKKRLIMKARTVHRSEVKFV